MTLPEEPTIYVKPNCGQCVATKTTFDRKGIEYKTVDITEDPEALEFFLSKGLRSAPIVVAGGDMWSGFRPDRIDALAESLAA